MTVSLPYAPGHVTARSTAPLEASLIHSSGHGTVSQALADSLATAGNQVGSHLNSASIVLNGRPTTHAAIDEYVAASELVRSTYNEGESEGGGTRSLWHEDLGGESHPTHIPTGAHTPVDRYVVGGAPSDITGQRMHTEYTPESSLDVETMVGHANRAREAFSPLSRATQGTWREQGQVEIDVSDITNNPVQARNRLVNRGEKALFWPNQFRPEEDKWGAVRAKRGGRYGIGNQDASVQFRQRLDTEFGV